MSVQSQIDRISGEVSTQKEIIAQIKTAMEGKASGGDSGVDVETCVVEAVNLAGELYTTICENGEFAPACLGIDGVVLQDRSISGVVCGSVLVVCIPKVFSVVVSGATQLFRSSQFPSVVVLQITAEAGETVTISAVYND